MQGSDKGNAVLDPKVSGSERRCKSEADFKCQAMDVDAAITAETEGDPAANEDEAVAGLEPVRT